MGAEPAAAATKSGRGRLAGVFTNGLTVSGALGAMAVTPARMAIPRLALWLAMLKEAGRGGCKGACQALQFEAERARQRLEVANKALGIQPRASYRSIGRPISRDKAAPGLVSPR